MNLPPMPAEAMQTSPLLAYTADQMRDYGAACYAAGMEAAAQKLEAIGGGLPFGAFIALRNAAAEIRAAMPPKP